MTQVLTLAFIFGTAIAIFGMLLYIVTQGAKEAERNRVTQELEHDAAEKLRKANQIITTRTDPDELERSLRDGSF